LSHILEIFGLAEIPKFRERMVTFAYKLEEADAGWVKLTYALSAQNPNDEKDGLVGREYALSRFAFGQTFTLYTLVDAYRQEFESLVRYGAVESYRQKYNL
jgi:hypothetical protein